MFFLPFPISLFEISQYIHVISDPIINSVTVFAVLSKESVEPDGNSLSGIVFSHSVLIEQLIATATIIITSAGGTIAWIKKIVTSNAEKIKEESKRQIEQTKIETKVAIEKNEMQINNVKKDLCYQLTANTNKLADKLEDQNKYFNSTITPMAKTLEKIDDKMDKSTESIAINKTRIDNHEHRIDRLEGDSSIDIRRFRIRNDEDNDDQNKS